MVDRYDCLHTWRKKRARARGVESDVILRARRSGIWLVGLRVPTAKLADITDFGLWRRERYGEEILALLSGATP